MQQVLPCFYTVSPDKIANLATHTLTTCFRRNPQRMDKDVYVDDSQGLDLEMVPLFCTHAVADAIASARYSGPLVAINLRNALSLSPPVPSCSKRLRGLPDSTILPSSMTTIRSIQVSVAIRWAMHSIVVPSNCVCRARCINWSLFASTDAVATRTLVRDVEDILRTHLHP